MLSENSGIIGYDDSLSSRYDNKYWYTVNNGPYNKSHKNDVEFWFAVDIQGWFSVCAQPMGDVVTK